MPFETLLSPLNLGSARIRNRIAFCAHRTNLAGKGSISDALIAYYSERARGGCGLVIVGEFSIHPNDQPYEKMIHLHHSGATPWLERLAGQIHEQDSLVFAHLTHRGFQSHGVISRLPIWGPEPTADIVHGEMCKAMEPGECEELVASFVQAATSLQRAGFDGIEIDVGEESLLRQFLSPLTNHREDCYGGSLEGRMKLTVEVIQAVKQAVGTGFPVGIRLCLDEVFWNAIALEEALNAARELESLGLVDFFNTTIGTYYNLYLAQASMHHPMAPALDKVSALKQAVSVPVFAGNRMPMPEHAEEVLQKGKADVIGWIRPLICDPWLPRKLNDGSIDDIVYCVSDNQNCVGRTARIKPISCIQNPQAGRETLVYRGCSSARNPSKRVIVVGAGPAGLKAALTAAKRGHHVTVHEKEEAPGGQLRLARLGPGRSEIWGVIENLTRRLEKLHVPVFTRSPLDAAAAVDLSPDVVIVATGSYPDPRPLKGNYGPPRVLNVWDVLRGTCPIGEKVLLVDEEGHYRALSAVEFLADQGRKVDVMTGESFVGLDLAPIGDLYVIRQRLLQKGVRFIPDTVVLEIRDTRVIVADKFTERISETGEYDTIVLALGNVSDDRLYRELKGSIPALFKAGDCVAPRRIDSAIMDGYRIAQAI